MKKKFWITIVCILVILFVIGLVCVISNNKESVQENHISQKEQNIENENVAPSKLEENEKQVSKKKQQELFNFIPKIYIEGIAPFDSSFMLDAVMNKIIDNNEEHDFSEANVDKHVMKIFGREAKINKEDVLEPDVAKSLFYYSKEAGSYAVIPVGYEGIYEYQILKNATETEEAYYVYTYTLIGGYSYDEDSITQD